MTEAMERALECISGGILFCSAVALVLFLHHAYQKEIREIPAARDSLMVYEEELSWNHLEE